LHARSNALRRLAPPGRRNLRLSLPNHGSHALNNRGYGGGPRLRLSICYISLSLPPVDCDERQWLRAQPAAR
jgi:hypothetical protein